ncbi:retrovirus-related pol polyprotein from transposon TNT 1-94 [Tanacetum coccineum]
MYRVVQHKESQINKTNSDLSSYRKCNATSRVRRPMSKDSSVMNSVLVNSKKAAKNVSVYVRKNKQKDNTFANVISDKENVIAIDVANDSKAKTLLCVSCGRDSNLYTISISDMAASSPVCLMSKATSTKSGLWHRRLKDYLCSACERGKSKKAFHPPKLVPSDYSKLELLHMDLCGPMRVASINGKKYILVIVDDFSRYTWVYFLRSKDETPEIIKKFITQAQMNYKAKVCKIRTDNGTEFKNATLKAHYEKLSIMQQFSIARTPQQNGVVERLHEDSPSTSLIIVDTHEAPPVVTTSDEQTSPISLIEVGEFDQEDIMLDFDGNARSLFYNPLKSCGNLVINSGSRPS